MWAVTVGPVAGFFSAVQHATDEGLVFVRTRAQKDADDLNAWLRETLHAPAEVVTYAVSDYPFRVLTTKPAWAEFMRQAALSINYGNVKDAVAQRQGIARARVYADAWGAFHQIEREDDAAYDAERERQMALDWDARDDLDWAAAEHAGYLSDPFHVGEQP